VSESGGRLGMRQGNRIQLASPSRQYTVLCCLGRSGRFRIAVAVDGGLIREYGLPCVRSSDHRFLPIHWRQQSTAKLNADLASGEDLGV